MRCCQWLVDQSAENPNILAKILFTDKRPSVTMFVKLWWFNKRLYCWTFRITWSLKQRSLNFLVNEMQPPLQDVPLDIREKMWFNARWSSTHFWQDLWHLIIIFFWPFKIYYGSRIVLKTSCRQIKFYPSPKLYCIVQVMWL